MDFIHDTSFYGPQQVSEGGEVPIPYAIPIAFTWTPEDGEVLLLHTFAETVTFPANFVDAAAGNVGTNPSTIWMLKVLKNGSQVGTVTVSTSGSFSFATTGGQDLVFNVGDELAAVSPAVAEGSIADFSVTIKGTRS